MKKALAIIGSLICGFLCNALICGFLGFLYLANPISFVVLSIPVIPGFSVLLNVSAKKLGIYRGVFITCAQLPIFVLTLVYFITSRIEYKHAHHGMFAGLSNLSYGIAAALFIPALLTTICAFITMFIILNKERKQKNEPQG